MLTITNGLETYFKSKAYKDDDLAKGEAAFPEIQQEQSQKRMAEFKANKGILSYHSEENMQHVQDLMTLFGEDPEKTIKNS